MPVQLDPTGLPVEVDGVFLRTPGLEGAAESYQGGSPGMRAAEETTPAMEQAMANEALLSQQSIELAGTNEIPMDVPGTRSTSYGEPAMEMEVQAPGESWGQLVLSSDEAGVITWHFAEEETGPAAETTRGGERRTYVIRRYVAAPEPGGAATRGLIGALGKKILKVIAFRLLDPIGARVGDYFAGKWEESKRPYRLRPFTPDDYTSNDTHPLAPAEWEALGRGRALLFVHGTTSRAHAAFGALPRGVMEELSRRYEGRVFAFDHFTLSEDPRKNLDWFCSHLPEGQKLDVDIVCHSRGGLVSRMLAERQGELSLRSREFRVGSVIFAAVPNRGTILADPRYMNDFVDAHTNLLNFLPTTGVVEALEGFITVAKQLAVGALKGLDGLQSMNPSGAFIRSLNVGPPAETRYFALGASFEPAVPGFRAYAMDRLTDKIFEEENDLVVPTEGVYAENGMGSFPVAERFLFDPTAGIGHTNFFGQPPVHEKLLEWLR